MKKTVMMVAAALAAFTVSAQQALHYGIKLPQYLQKFMAITP